MSSKVRQFFSGLSRKLHLTMPIPAGTSVSSAFPILQPLKELYLKIQAMTNKYAVYHILKETDTELYGAIDRLSKMVRYSYGGLQVRAGRKLDENEKLLLQRLKAFEKEWNVKAFFYAAADRLITYGDDISLTNFNETGLIEWRALPIELVTILQDKKQRNDASAQVWKANVYVMNELSADEDIYKEFNPEQILHISLNNRAEIVYDTLNRYTFGIWSMSPLEPLKYKLQWKMALMINDMLLRQKIIPREHIKIDLSNFDPNLFAGDTQEARIQAAKTALDTFMTTFKNDFATPLKDVDKSYITGKDTEIDFVEPKHITYVDPNPMFDQINQSIWAVTGPLEAAVTSHSGQTYASELKIGSVADLIAETIADIIKEPVLDLVKRHFKLRYRYTDEQLEIIDIKIQLAYGVQLGEQIRQMAVLSATQCFTSDEIRAMLRYEPLTEDQRAEIVERVGPGRIGQHAQTLNDILRDYIKRHPEAITELPETPESRHDRQVT